MRPPILVGQFYDAAPSDGVVRLRLVRGPLPELEVVSGELTGAQVRVSARAVLVEAGPDGELVGRAMPALAAGGSRLCFDPARGGVRTRDNRMARGAHNDAVEQATGFGMVNAFLHSTRITEYFNRLLAELGAPMLPELRVVVAAHSGSRLPGFAQGDGDYRSGRMRPLAGGHYRLSQRTTGVPEPLPVVPTGEVHLGPGRLSQQFAGQDGYLRSAAHNPATIYHELGHHLCRHTADFRLNAERAPAEQRNGKIGADEGVCDYLTASFLGTGRPYGWYRAERGERRDPDAWRELDVAPEDAHEAIREDAHEYIHEREHGDVHDVGARWAALWWRCRRRLLDGGMASGADHDRVVVAALLAVGQVGRQAGHGVRPQSAQRAKAEGIRADGDRPEVDRAERDLAERDLAKGRRQRQQTRCAAGTVLDAYVQATRELLGPVAAGHVREIADTFGGAEQRGSVGGAEQRGSVCRLESPRGQRAC
jgi:hypothetical protein